MRIFILLLLGNLIFISVIFGQNGNEKDQKLINIQLPDGFSAVTVIDELGSNRHLVVHPNGTIYVHLRDLKNGKGIMILRDLNGDGTADSVKGIGHFRGTGIALKGNYLYASSNSDIFRYTLDRDGNVLNPDVPDKIVGGLTNHEQHNSKAFALDNSGNLYVNIGAPSNSCQESDRMKGSKGKDPCPILNYAAGIWKFSISKLNQTQAGGERYATGLRNIVALDWNTEVGSLYVVQHGRDELDRLFPDKFTPEQNAELPAEEMFRIKKGGNYGWPYCYYDPQQKKKLLSPEYGGDGKMTGRCASMEKPIMAFPAHWSPNDLLFYTGNMFPEKYRNGAFIAFHGSWNRMPFKQKGYYVVFVPMKKGMPSGNYEVFASGFEGGEINRSDEAVHRACGLAQGPDGSLYISDSKKGKIWKISYSRN